MGSSLTHTLIHYLDVCFALLGLLLSRRALHRFVASPSAHFVQIPDAGGHTVLPESRHGARNLRHVALAPTTHALSQRTFCICSKLRLIHLPLALCVIHARAISCCSALQRIIFPSTVTVSCIQQCSKDAVVSQKCSPAMRCLQIGCTRNSGLYPLRCSSVACSCDLLPFAYITPSSQKPASGVRG